MSDVERRNRIRECGILIVTTCGLLGVASEMSWAADASAGKGGAKEPGPVPTGANAMTGVPWVADACKALGVTLASGADTLLLDEKTRLEGSFSCQGEVRVESGLGSLSFPLAQVAAIAGGAGHGREGRVFLRDGSVFSGGLDVEGARFESKALGPLQLKVEALDLLMLRGQKGDGAKPQGAVAVAATERGDVFWIKDLPAATLNLRWAGGELGVPWKSVRTVWRRAEGGRWVELIDGSRIASWVLANQTELTALLPGGAAVPWPLANGLRALAPDAILLANRLAAANDTGAVVASSNLFGSALETADGSWWQGRPRGDVVHVRSPLGAAEIKLADIQFIDLAEEDSANAGGVRFEIRTYDGTQIVAQVADENLEWECDAGVTVPVPWHRINAIRMAAKPGGGS